MRQEESGKSPALAVEEEAKMAKDGGGKGKSGAIYMAGVIGGTVIAVAVPFIALKFGQPGSEEFVQDLAFSGLIIGGVAVIVSIVFRK